MKTLKKITTSNNRNGYSKLNIKNLRIVSLYSVLNKRLRFYVFFLLFCLLITSITELVGIASIIPLLNTLNNDQYLSSGLIGQYTTLISSALEIKRELLLFFSTIVLIIISYIARIFSNYFILFTAGEIGLYLHNKALSSFLSNSYANQQGLLNKKLAYCLTQQINQVVSGFIYPLLNAISSLLILFMLSGSLFLYSPKASFSLIFLASFFYILVGIPFSGWLSKGAKILNIKSNEHLIILSGLKSFLKQLKLYSLEESIYKKLSHLQKNIRSYIVKKNFIGSYPRPLLEFCILIIFIVFVYFTALKDSDLGNLSGFVFIVIIMQKLFPVIQSIYVAWTNLVANSHSADDVLQVINSRDKEIRQKIYIDSDKLKFIELKNVYFSYSDFENELIFKALNLNIDLSDSYVITAPSGSGKSTLVDLILGLQKESKGSIKYKGDDFEISSTDLDTGSFVSYVPQENFFFDGSLREIIKYNYKNLNISDKRIFASAEIALIDDLLERLPNGLATICSNNLSNFSGGQKQRLGICQALLNPNLKILILDETLSNIDKKSSCKILEKIKHSFPEICVLLITHDLEIVPKYFKKINLLDLNK